MCILLSNENLTFSNCPLLFVIYQYFIFYFTYFVSTNCLGVRSELLFHWLKRPLYAHLECYIYMTIVVVVLILRFHLTHNFFLILKLET